MKKLFGFILVSIVCFSPFEGYLLVRYLLAPIGFWQNFILAGIALYVGGFIQFFLFFVWIMAIGYFWFPQKIGFYSR